MKQQLILVSAFLLSACDLQLPKNNTRVIDTALQYKGLHEVEDKQVLQQYLGIDPSRIEWCAAFVNNVLDESGIASIEAEGYEYPLLARGYFTWGYGVDKSQIQFGDVVLFSRGTAGWQGHVGFYVGTTHDGLWNILGGNQNDKVGIDSFRPEYAMQVRRHTEFSHIYQKK